jgi:hypothetical protein
MDVQVVAAAKIVAEMLLLCLKVEHNRKKHVWTWEWKKRRSQSGDSVILLKEIVVEDPKSYFNHSRLTSKQFGFLLSRVENAIRKKDTIMHEALSPELKLKIMLQFMASRDSYPSLQYLYCVPKATTAKFVPEVCDAIYADLQEHMKVGDENVTKTHLYRNLFEN